MAGGKTAVVGIYATHSSLEIGVQALKDAGFRPTDVSVLYPEDLGINDSAHKKTTKAPEGAATGASAGALMGGAWGWLAGAGSLTIPGMGLFLAAGPIMAALVGAGAGGVVGGLAGGLAGLGVAEDRAHLLQDRIKGGGTLLSIHSDNSHWWKRAEEILEVTGAQDISSTGETDAEFPHSERCLTRSA